MMEAQTHSEEVQKKAVEMSVAIGGAEAVKDAANRESPLDEVRRLNRETKELVGELTRVKDDLTNLAAFTALSGRAVVNAPKQSTPEEEKAAAVLALASRLRGK